MGAGGIREGMGREVGTWVVRIYRIQNVVQMSWVFDMMNFVSSPLFSVFRFLLVRNHRASDAFIE